MAHSGARQQTRVLLAWLNVTACRGRKGPVCADRTPGSRCSPGGNAGWLPQHEVGLLPGLDVARVLLPSPWDALLSLSVPSFPFPRP